MLNGHWPHGKKTWNWDTDAKVINNKGRAVSRGLLRDCTTSPINRFAALVMCDAGVKCCGVLWAAADVLLCRVSAGGPGPPPPWRKLKPVLVAELLSCIAHLHPHWTIKPTLPINSDTGHISVHLAIFQQLCCCQSTQLSVDHTHTLKYLYLT